MILFLFCVSGLILSLLGMFILGIPYMILWLSCPCLSWVYHVWIGHSCSCILGQPHMNMSLLGMFFLSIWFWEFWEYNISFLRIPHMILSLCMSFLKLPCMILSLLGMSFLGIPHMILSLLSMSVLGIPSTILSLVHVNLGHISYESVFFGHTSHDSVTFGHTLYNSVPPGHTSYYSVTLGLPHISPLLIIPCMIFSLL